MDLVLEATPRGNKMWCYLDYSFGNSYHCCLKRPSGPFLVVLDFWSVGRRAGWWDEGGGGVCCLYVEEFTMMMQTRVLRFFLRAVPKKSNPKYYEWETASICIFVVESDRDAAEVKVRRELEKRHWTLIRIENLDVLIDC